MDSPDPVPGPADAVTGEIHSVLVANRGEIALRVFHTCRRLGIRTIALHTDLDVAAPHVQAADEAHRVSSYLDVDEVVAVALACGADAVHPGYGFLSERAAFARALDAAGVRLVGPSAEVMDAMGRKDAAREIAVAAGVPVVPAYSLDDDPASFAYPVLVKAASGGGGKGMRVVRSASELPDAVAAARRESATAFGDDTLLVEKYVESGRHIEVQVVGDHHGTVRHFFERDCSTQRRHQKVVEEAPAPTIGEEQRGEITAAAVALAQQVGYANAGTVEFLLDDATGEFYFLEMNTRLQVEHPVTEEVVRVRGERVDLVELQLLVTSGQAISFGQDDVTLEGHAIEARVYAEDSFAGFLPQAGRASLVRWPERPARVDHALKSGQEVSTSYDPMLGKVIAGGPDREAARSALLTALDHTAILGLTTNTGFLRALVDRAEFRDAAIDTAWLDRHELEPPTDDVARTLAALALTPQASDDPHPWRADGWRLGAPPAATVVDLDRPVAVRPHEVDGSAVEVLDQTTYADGMVLEVMLDGERQAGLVRRHGTEVEVAHRGQRHLFEVPDAFADHGPETGDGTITAPMPGTVLDVGVDRGQQVAEGDTLVTLEAMKMEITLRAPFAGTVAALDATVGQQVRLGHELVVVEPGDVMGGGGHDDHSS